MPNYDEKLDPPLWPDCWLCLQVGDAAGATRIETGVLTRVLHGRITYKCPCGSKFERREAGDLNEEAAAFVKEHTQHLPEEGVPYPYWCIGCDSLGFEVSRVEKACTFCDGTEGGHPPIFDEKQQKWVRA